MRTNLLYRLAFVVLCMLGANVSAYAAAPDDKQALGELKVVKVIYDITTGDAKKLLSRLGLIEETRDTMVKQGVKVHFIVAFRGGASLLVQKDESRIKPDDLAIAAKIKQKLGEMSKDEAYELNQCAVANRYLKIKNEDTIPEVHVIGNSWVSLAAYQNRGYAYIPVD
jgi:intracellular sulfur oxidation DsrE/DsrF family protein